MSPPDPLQVRLTRIDGARDRPLFPAGEIRFDLPAGHLACLLGPRGCGKTALLNVLAGLDGAGTAGIDPPPHDLRIAFLHSQSLRAATIGAADSAVLTIERSAPGQSLAQRLARGEGRSPPRPGVQSRRDALATALRQRPDLLLIDAPRIEPDPSSARLFREVLVGHWQPAATSIVMVAPLDDALLLADRLLLLSPRPTRLVLDLAIPLPRPRQLAMPELVELRDRLVTDYPLLFPEHSADA